MFIFYFLLADADSICTKIAERINVSGTQLGQFNKVGFAHIPLLIVCLDALGKIAEKVPVIAGTSVISTLTDFLMQPSPIIRRLGEIAVSKANTPQPVDVSPKVKFCINLMICFF